MCKWAMSITEIIKCKGSTRQTKKSKYLEIRTINKKGMENERNQIKKYGNQQFQKN